MAVNYGFLQSLQGGNVNDYANEETQRRSQLQQQALQQDLLKVQKQSAQEKMRDERRNNLLQMHASIANLPPEQQQATYEKLKPVFGQIDPTVQWGDSYDPAVGEYAKNFLIGPKDQFNQKMMLERIQAQQAAKGGMMIDPDSGAVVTQPMPEKPGKALPMNAMKDLEKKANAYQEATRIVGGFKPEFGGNPMIGGLENLAGRMGGEALGLADPGQSQWWQDYQGHINQIRNDLFGSALTPTEKAEFEKAIVTPGMAPEQIATNLARQQAIVQNGLVRGRNVYQKGGYNKEQIGEYAPEDLQGVDVTQPMLGGKPAVPGAAATGNTPIIKSPNDPAFANLPSGARFLTADGQMRVKK